MSPLFSLNTLQSTQLERYVRLARRIFDVPIARVSLEDTNRRWLPAGPSLLVIPDVRVDPRFSGNPMLSGVPGARFYAGRTLWSSKGVVLGTLCLLDHQPRLFSSLDAAMLEDLAEVLGEALGAAELATIDPMTHLPNQRGFLHIAGHLLHSCCRLEESVIMAAVDIDELSELRQQHGMDAGKQAMQDLGELLHGVLRRSDAVGRLGDGMFGALCTGTTAEAAIRGRIAQAISEHNSSGARPWKLSVTIGMEAYDPAFHQSAADLLRGASALMCATRSLRRRALGVG